VIGKGASGCGGWVARAHPNRGMFGTRVYLELHVRWPRTGSATPAANLGF